MIEIGSHRKQKPTIAKEKEILNSVVLASQIKKVFLE
jgi:hypothetical protein